MKNIHNPHDKLFKETFSHLDVVADFVKHYVPKKIARHIDVSSLKLQKDNFIQKNLAEYYSDLLFKASFDGHQGYLYILFEHKSYPYLHVALQLLRYMVEIWEVKIDKEREQDLPVILPIVLYQGKQIWEKPKTIHELIGGEKGLYPALRHMSHTSKFYFTIFPDMVK